MVIMETLVLTFPKPHIALVTINRPKKLNAMNLKMYQEIQSTFESLGSNPEVWVIIITGSEKTFCAGMDLNDFASLGNYHSEDPARRALYLQKGVKSLQDPISSLENCGKPVIAAVSGYCIGAGVDLLSACDIRYCSKNAMVSVREVVIGMAADIGSLQRLPKIVGNDSWIRELVFTGRDATAQESKENGLFSKIFNTHEELLQEAMKIAEIIAQRSPIAIIGSKRNLSYARDHSVSEGLNFVANWNGWALQSPDFMNAIMAQMQKKKPEFPKL